MRSLDAGVFQRRHREERLNERTFVVSRAAAENESVRDLSGEWRKTPGIGIHRLHIAMNYQAESGRRLELSRRRQFDLYNFSSIPKCESEVVGGAHEPRPLPLVRFRISVRRRKAKDLSQEGDEILRFYAVVPMLNELDRCNEEKRNHCPPSFILLIQTGRRIQYLSRLIFAVATQSSLPETSRSLI